jgi:hypothetical protein
VDVDPRRVRIAHQHPSPSSAERSVGAEEHWLDPGLPDVDCRHWVPFMEGGELGIDAPKLVLDQRSGVSRPEASPAITQRSS